MDTFTPLKSLPQWDKRIRSGISSIPFLLSHISLHLSRQQKVDGSDSVFAAGLDDPRSVVVQVSSFALVARDSCSLIIALGIHQLYFSVVPAWKQLAVLEPYS
jgi:hypothetical protein